MTITAAQLQQRFPQLVKKFNHRELQILLDAMERVDVPAGGQLLRCGEPADALNLVWEGALQVSIGIGDQEIPIGTVGQGHFVGIAAIIDPGLAVAHVSAARPSIVLRLTHAELEALRRNQPGVGGKLTRALSFELAEWLRTFEEYIAEREKPNDVEEFAQTVRHLMGFKEPVA